MKLRNKKTGEIKADFAYILLESTNYRTYNSISELCDEWEDYAPAEPLIKDEKIRKAVRAWAEANGIESIVVFDNTVSKYVLKGYLVFAENGGRTKMEIRTDERIDHNKSYTLAELCGEEEEC